MEDREILDRARRFERALATWQSGARGFRRTTIALQDASDELYRRANDALNVEDSLFPDQTEQPAPSD